MTDLVTDRTPYLPTARPVRRFVVALVSLAVLFGALWWSGLVTPRVTHGDRYGSSLSGSYDSVSGRATMAFGLRNDSLVAVDLRGVTLGERVTVTSARVDGHDLATGSQRLAGRGGRTRVQLEITCRAGGVMARERPAGIEVRVGTAIGLERTRVAGTIPLPQACFG